MNCKYFCVRTEKGNKYKYCRLRKCKIEDCYRCKAKEYRTYKKQKKHISKRTKATSIQKDVKEVVWHRDNQRCIFCNTLVAKSKANAHFIPRSQGGLGIEENMFTACDYCHAEQDNGLNTKEYEEKAERYLRSLYVGWNKSDLIYKKWR